jgi:hypothetical protein
MTDEPMFITDHLCSEKVNRLCTGQRIRTLCGESVLYFCYNGVVTHIAVTGIASRIVARRETRGLHVKCSTCAVKLEVAWPLILLGQTML